MRSSKSSLWAVHLRDWVEIREHSKPPQVTKSGFKVKVKARRQKYDDLWAWPPRYEDILIDRELSQFNAAGGRLITTLGYRKFYGLTKVPMKVGTFHLLTGSQSDSIRRSLTRL